MSQAACQIIIQDGDVRAAASMALSVAQAVESAGKPVPEATLQAVADAWKDAAEATAAALAEFV